MQLDRPNLWECLTKIAFLFFALITLFHFELAAAVRCEEYFFDRSNTYQKTTNAHKNWTEEEANDFAWNLINHFTPKFDLQKRSPMLKLHWESTEIDIRVQNDGMFDNIIISGEIFRRKDIDPDMIALMIGHEIGHILGKRLPGREGDYAVEGEADFFGAAAFAEFFKSKLLPARYDTQSEAYLKAKEQIGDPEYKNSYGDKPHEMHVRALMAAYKNLTLESSDITINYNTTDRTVVTLTTETYPSSQIRLDTTRAALYGYGRPKSWALHSDFEVVHSSIAKSTESRTFSIQDSIPQVELLNTKKNKVRETNKANSFLNRLKRIVPRYLRRFRPSVTSEDLGLLNKSYEYQIGGNPREMGIVKFIDYQGNILDQETVWGEYQSIRLANSINILLNRNRYRFSEIAKIVTKHTHPLDLIDNPSLTAVFSDKDIENQKNARKVFDKDPLLRHIGLEHSIIYIDTGYANSSENSYELTNVIKGKSKISSKNVRVLSVSDPGK